MLPWPSFAAERAALKSDSGQRVAEEFPEVVRLLGLVICEAHDVDDDDSGAAAAAAVWLIGDIDVKDHQKCNIRS